MKKYIVGLKISTIVKFISIILAGASNAYGLVLLAKDGENWDFYILGSMLVLGISYILSITEKHFKHKMVYLAVDTYARELAKECSSEENPIEKVNYKVKELSVVTYELQEGDKTLAISIDKNGVYLTEMPKEIKFKGVFVSNESLEISDTKVSFNPLTARNETTIQPKEKADDN